MRTLVLLLLFLTSCLTWAQTPNGDILRLITTQEADHKISPRVSCLFEDSKGRVWFGTEAIYEQTNSLGSPVELIREGLYFLEDSSVFHISSEELGIEPDKSVFGRSRINDITEYKGQIVVASSKGLIIGQPGSWKTYSEANSGLSNDKVFALGPDEEGNLWMSHFPDQGITKWDGETDWELYDSKAGFKGAFVKCFSAYDGIVYCAAQNRIYDHKGGVFIEHRKGLFGLGNEQLFGAVYGSDTNHLGVYFGAGPVIALFTSFEIKTERVDRSSFAFAPSALSVNKDELLIASGYKRRDQMDQNSKIESEFGIAVYSADLKDLTYELQISNTSLAENLFPESELSSNGSSLRKPSEIIVNDALIDSRANYWIASSKGLILHNPNGIRW